jgi:hypothetical protein
VRSKLSPIKRQYKLLTLNLVIDSKTAQAETIHFTASASEEEKGQSREVQVAGAAELAQAVKELERLEDKLIRAIEEGKKKPTRAELDNLETLLRLAAQAELNRRPSLNEFSRWRSEKGLAERVNNLNLGKARLQDVENIGGEAEHTRGARGSTAETHERGQSTKSQQQIGAEERLLSGVAERVKKGREEEGNND